MRFLINSFARGPKPGLISGILLLLLFGIDIFGQKVTEPSYDHSKFQSYEDAKEATNSQEDAKAEMAALRSSQFSTKPATACSGNYIPHDGTFTAVPRNDDGSFGPINLGWTFSFCGDSFTQVWINTNGNLTFTGPLAQFSANGFPFGTPMVAAFWSDIDTRNLACGQIWYKLTPNYLIASWDNTGYYNQQCDKTVSFNLVISDGTLAGGLGVGNTIGFRYGDMQFTTGSASGGVNGFGGVPATVGFNSGNNTNFEQIGRFDQPGTSYDGGFGANDGVDFLDNKCFVFKSNNPPTALCKNALIALGPTGTTLINPKLIDNGSLDDCSALTYAVNPASVSCADIWTNQVTLTVTDNIGQTATCVATLSVKDFQVPTIVCPPNVTVSCEIPVVPANIGTPKTSFNCPVILSYSDITIPGACTHDYTLSRTWTASDGFGNATNCVQAIKVEDMKKPVIRCPPDITVTCALGIIGKANARDNCDPSVTISHQDFLVYGDRDYYCILERHWKAEDDCSNTQSCIQHITVDVTPFIEEALEAGPLVWGQDQATVTLMPGQASCFVKWFPHTDTTPTSLKFDDAVAGPPCTLMSNPLNKGRIVNPLLGEAMKLKLLVRLNPALGTTKLSTFPCQIHLIVRQAMAPNPDVNELLRVTDLTLGNINANLLVPQHTLYLLDVQKCVNAGKNFCEW